MRASRPNAAGLCRRQSTPAFTGLAVLSVLVLTAAACGGAGDRLDKPGGSALWLSAADLPRLDAATRDVLRRGGIRELFLEAGSFTGEGAGFASRLGAASGLRMPATLVVGGEWPGGEPEEVAAVLAPALRALRRGAEERGLTPVGYHLDVVPPRGEDALEAWAETLAELRGALDDDLFVSVSLDAKTLRAEAAAEISAAVDFTVPFLYGPRPDGGPAPAGDDAWRLTAMEPALARLAELGRPYLLGLGTAGLMRRLVAGGSEVTETTEGRLRQVVARPGLAPGRAGLFDAFDRQSYGFEAERAVEVGPWRLARGDQVEVWRLGAPQLRRAAQRAEEVSPRLHLGQVYVRLPRPEEGLWPAPSELAAVAGEEPLLPRLELSLLPAGVRRGSFRVRLENHGPLATDVAFYETNYVELRALGDGTFAGAEPGGFQRYQLEHEGRRVADMRSLRAADHLKLYLPLLEPGEAVVSGAVQMRGVPRSGRVAEATARFAVPGGEQVEVGPIGWPATDGADP
jgi:hypothetical protein